jgi:hypothetical protein
MHSTNFHLDRFASANGKCYTDSFGQCHTNAYAVKHSSTDTNANSCSSFSKQRTHAAVNWN